MHCQIVTAVHRFSEATPKGDFVLIETPFQFYLKPVRLRVTRAQRNQAARHLNRFASARSSGKPSSPQQFLESSGAVAMIWRTPRLRPAPPPVRKGGSWLWVLPQLCPPHPGTLCRQRRAPQAWQPSHAYSDRGPSEPWLDIRDSLPSSPPWRSGRGPSERRS